jgi:hypothetical protein
MIMIRHSLSALLVALLILTAQSMAVARGSSMIAGQIVLCTGTGPVIVNTDRNGAPVAPAHVCPDCVISFGVDVAPVVAPAQPVFAELQLRWGGLSALVAQAGSPAHRARSPPLEQVFQSG